MMKFASESTKPFVDDYLLSDDVQTAVNQNYIHIHDKDYYPTKSLTCVQHPMDKILKGGLSTGHCESRPAKRFFPNFVNLDASYNHHELWREDDKAQELGLKIVGYMRDRVMDFSTRYGHNYSVLATPAEGLSGRFTRRDKKDFGIIPGVTDKDYYTNSNHIPVYYKCSPQHKAAIEAPYHKLTGGGHNEYC